MKAVRIYKRNGEIITKFDSFDIYNTAKALVKNLPDVCLLTSAESRFNSEDHGCINLGDGNWKYLPDSAFEEIKEIRL